MNTVYNGDGNGAKDTLQKPRKAALPPPPSPADPKDAQIIFRASTDEVLLTGLPVRLAYHSVVFDLFNPLVVPRLSESLAEFRINLNNRLLYSGRAVVRNVLNTGGKVVCEATLDDTAWHDTTGESTTDSQSLTKEFGQFLKNWQTFYKVTPEFKVVVADLQTFLHDLQLWLNQLEIAAPRAKTSNKTWEKEILAGLSGQITKTIDTFTDRFESMVCDLSPEYHPVYQAYLRRLLHPFLLKSPFANRAYKKPLGYAGDYQMVDMMLRSPEEGEDLFSKLVNIWLLSQTPAQAHRNRVTYLKKRLVAEATRAKFAGHRLQVLNLGCGPAGEIQDFAKNEEVCSLVDFTLVDFNAETLDFLRRQLTTIGTSNRAIYFRMLQKSVYQILKEGGRGMTPKNGIYYDYIYCAGLFDYLSDVVCKQLMGVFYELLAPGGLLLVTNASDVMNSSRPFRYSMEYFLDWHLIYRNQEQFQRVVPDGVTAEEVSTIAESTGANLFLEIRKTANA